jgi:hypothetical protein
MRRPILILLVFISLFSCTHKEKTYYFYNANGLFHRTIIRNDSISYLNYETSKPIPPSDSFSIERGWKVYGLNHYYKLSSYSDSSFVKHKSCLDSIDYYGGEWFKKEENLDKFWKSCHGRFDSLKIYTIEPVEGTDSLIFRRVHRYFNMFAG